jgi:aerobic-type carbon monoxide dehydrogenase small subunit (CoxS/CutS family)
LGFRQRSFTLHFFSWEVLMATITRLEINGQPREIDADAGRSLLSVLRDDLALGGCKYGCGEGECGACTVLIDGRATRSCITPLADCGGKRITTIEGLAAGDKLHPLQQAFLDCGALQCGYCTPGMILSGAALLAKHRQPTREQIVEAMEGNVCRCGTYGRIVEAIERAAKGGAA